MFDRAYAASPVTLPSHATLLTGRYPPGHGSRDNGLRVSADVPTLATVLQRARRQDRGVRRRVPARPSVRPESRLRRLRRPDPARPGRPRRERAARVAGRRRSHRVAEAARSPKPSALSAHPPHLPHLPHLPSSCGSTSSNRTRRTAIRPPAGRRWTATTTRSRRSTVKSVDCSARWGRRGATR